MWNKLINYATALCLCLLSFSCKEVSDNFANIHQMEDSLFKRYPTVNRVSIEVKEYSDVYVTLGDAELYNAPEADRQKITDEIAALTVQIFEKNNYLDEGTVIFVKEENTIEVKEEDKKKYDMQLKKLMSVGK